MKREMNVGNAVTKKETRLSSWLVIKQNGQRSVSVCEQPHTIDENNSK